MEWRARFFEESTVFSAICEAASLFADHETFPSPEEIDLALHAIVVQQLVPRADGRGRLPATELLLATYPVRHHIRSDNLQKLYNEITLGRRHGMISMEESLSQLALQGLIDPEEARVRASHPEEVESQLR